MQQIFGALPAVLNDLGSNTRVEEAFVFAAWKRCAGAPLSDRTLPLEVFENRLIVAVEDDMWRRHLEDLSPLMIARLNGLLSEGRIRFIEFRVEPRRFTRVNKTADSAGEDRPDLPVSLAAAAEGIADPDLRAAFLDAASNYLARQETES